MSHILALLLRIGIVRRRDDGTIVWPVHLAPRHCWRRPIANLRFWGAFYVFRNVPGVIKWLPGRLLPRRWGFGIAGLIELGDRG